MFCENSVMFNFSMDAYLAWRARCLTDTQRAFPCSGTRLTKYYCKLSVQILLPKECDIKSTKIRSNECDKLPGMQIQGLNCNQQSNLRGTEQTQARAGKHGHARTRCVRHSPSFRTQ